MYIQHFSENNCDKIVTQNVNVAKDLFKGYHCSSTGTVLFALLKFLLNLIIFCTFVLETLIKRKKRCGLFCLVEVFNGIVRLYSKCFAF